MSTASIPSGAIDLGFLATLLGIVASASLAASLCYDWGFLTALQLSFGDVPTTISDHTRSALLWLPGAALVVLWNYTYELLYKRVDTGILDAEYIATARNKTLSKIFRRGPSYLIYLLLVGFLVEYVLFGGQLLGYALIALAAIWPLYVRWSLLHPRVFNQYHRFTKLALLIVPPLAALLFAAGWSDGVHRVEYGQPAFVYQKDKSEIERVILLRFYEQGVLFSTRDKIAFERWDSVARIDIAPRHELRQGVLCDWFHLCYADSNPLAPPRVAPPNTR